MADFKIKAKSNAVDFAQRLTNFGTEFKRANWWAIVQTTEEVRKQLYAEMRRVFDRPTPFTMNSLETVKSTKTDDNPKGEVRTKLGFGSVPAGRYLDPQVEGGDRRAKSLEIRIGSYAVPSKYAELDVYGNIPGGLTRKIISNLGVSADSKDNISGSKRSRRNRAKEVYFRRGNIIFRRTAQFVGSSNVQPILPVMILVSGSPRYRKRFAFYDVASRVADEHYPMVFEREIDEKMARLGL